MKLTKEQKQLINKNYGYNKIIVYKLTKETIEFQKEILSHYIK